MAIDDLKKRKQNCLVIPDLGMESIVSPSPVMPEFSAQSLIMSAQPTFCLTFSADR